MSIIFHAPRWSAILGDREFLHPIQSSRPQRVALHCGLIALLLFAFAGCNRNALSGSKLTSANYDQITMGMSKAQVETILGKPTTAESKDMLIFKKTTYRYEEGAKFAMITFKNDEVDSKDTNLGRQP